MLLTNDGDLAHRLMHPSFGVAKTYLATVGAPVGRDVARRLRAGVVLDDGPASVDSFRVVQTSGPRAIVEVVLHEGRKHIVRRLLAEVGHPVQRLVRTRSARCASAGSGQGAVRPLSREELAGLHRLVDELAPVVSLAWRCGRFGARSRSMRTSASRSWTVRPSWSRRVLERNDLTNDDLISIVFTATPDITSEFPAYAARLMGMTDVPLLCTTEIAVPGAMPRVLRVLAHVETAETARRTAPPVPARGGSAAPRPAPGLSSAACVADDGVSCRSGPLADRTLGPVGFTGVVALDGPSGTGKSTVARRLASALGARYLDTGAMYRAATLAVLRAGVDPADAGRRRRGGREGPDRASRPTRGTPASSWTANRSTPRSGPPR